MFFSLARCSSMAALSASLRLTSSQAVVRFSSTWAIVFMPAAATETFGLVQVEAMLCGTPSIASDLPGVRQPVLQTGMGEVVPVGDSQALAEAVIRVGRSKPDYARSREEIAERWSVERTAAAYEALFERLLEEKRAS